MKNLLSIYIITVNLLLGLSCINAKVVYHQFNISYFSGSPDGVYKDKILGINGRFPGPTIVADLGDIIEVDVINNIQDGQNTSMHWHGIHQKNSHFEDGATYISQCPIKLGQVQKYKFQITQAGTFWYHSHVNSQYTEGLWGIFIVHNQPKEIYTYDDEIIVTLNDWYHRTALENEEWHLHPRSRGVPPYPDTGLINGLGRYPLEYAILQNRTCQPNLQMRTVYTVQPNKIYRVRVINTGAVSGFNFSIDGHKLETIEVDGIDVAKPIIVDIAPIYAGQRYSFLLRTTNISIKRFLIRSHLRIESLMLIEGANINEYPQALIANATAVLEYSQRIVISPEPHSYLDIDPPMAIINPIYLNENDLSPHSGGPAPSKVDQEIVLEVGFYEDHEDIRRGSFNQTPFVTPTEGKPLLMKLLNGEPIPDSTFPIEIGYMNVIQIIINNPFFGPHPFHLHGHHFWVLGTGSWYDGNYIPEIHNQTLTLNGVKRDTFLVQEHSWGVIRFVADNPGVWIFHCHIDWHMLSGMAMVFIEAKELAKTQIKVTDEANRICGYPYDTNNTAISHSSYKNYI